MKAAPLANSVANDIQKYGHYRGVLKTPRRTGMCLKMNDTLRAIPFDKRDKAWEVLTAAIIREAKIVPKTRKKTETRAAFEQHPGDAVVEWNDKTDTKVVLKTLRSIKD